MKKNVLLIIGLLTMVTIVFVNAKKTTPSTIKGGYEVGSEVKDFSLKNIDGKTVSMSDYTEAKGFIVVFTCNTCPYAKMYEKRIDNLNLKYADKGYPVLAINPNDKEKQPGDSFDEMTARAKDKNYSFPYLYDENQEVALRYGATRTPHIYIVNKEAKNLKVVYIGAIDNNPKDAKSVDVKYVEEAVNNLLDGKTVETTKTKAIGCSIKWKEA
ncbi:MAG: thioredoxin family protein [Reichenbachiella sp.]